LFSKNFCAYQFVSLDITSTSSGVQNNPKYSRGSSKSTSMPGLPVNGKCGHSAPDFAYMSWCMLQLSLTFSSSSELTLCSPRDEICTLFHCHYSICSQKYHYIVLQQFIQHLFIIYTHLVTRTWHNVYSQKLKPRAAIKHSAPSCHTLK
jgi:hypothetical protein